MEIKNRKPRGYWTEERCRGEALKYKTIYEWRNLSCSSYAIAKTKKYFKSCKSHMIRKSMLYWTKDKCEKEALKYYNVSEWCKNSSGSYSSAIKNGWVSECKKHMQSLVIYWTEKRCRKEALKYKIKKDWKKFSKGSYDAARKYKIVENCSVHMKELLKPSGYWTLERCKEDALKYKSRMEWKMCSKAGYVQAGYKGFADECCGHMKPIGNIYKRLIYAYEFSDKSVYVGLTYNEDDRKKEHLFNKNTRENSSVYKHIKKTNLEPTYKKISDYIDVESAQKLEGSTVSKYRENGWNILNKSKTGALGSGIRKWTKEACSLAALKCKTRKEFKEKYRSAYGRSICDGYLNEICSHMKVKVKHG